MIILGVDPGLRHTGYALVDGPRLVSRGTIDLSSPDPTPLTPVDVIPSVLRELVDLAGLAAVGAVEEVVWQGQRRRGMLPLAHVAGAVAAWLLGQGIPVYLLTPAMKHKGAIPKGIARRLKTPHERDAYRLARFAARAEQRLYRTAKAQLASRVECAAGNSVPKGLLAAVRRRLSVEGCVRGSA